MNISGKFIGWVVVALVIVVGLLFLNPIYTINQGEEGVVTNFGQVVGTADPGLHFRIPLVQGYSTISTQSHFADFPNKDYGVAAFEAYSRDQQPANIQISVNYHISPDKAQQVYSEYGSDDALVYRTLYQAVPAVFKNVFGTVDAQTAIQSRAKLNQDVLSALQVALDHEPIVIESVQTKDIKFSADYEAAIAAKQQATVKVQEQQQILDQEKIKAQITVTQAQAVADSQLAQAKANAQAVQLAGDAEAAAIRAKGDALKDNPSLVDLTKAERWDGKLPQTVVPGSTLPFLEVPTVAPAAH